MADFWIEVRAIFAYVITLPVIWILTVPAFVWLWAYKIYREQRRAFREARKRRARG